MKLEDIAKETWHRHSDPSYPEVWVFRDAADHHDACSAREFVAKAAPEMLGLLLALDRLRQFSDYGSSSVPCGAAIKELLARLRSEVRA